MNIDVAATVEKRYNEELKEQNDGKKFVSTVTKHPLIQIYCTTKNGNSVCVNVRDFVPYFFAPFPSQLDATQENL